MPEILSPAAVAAMQQRAAAATPGPWDVIKPPTRTQAFGVLSVHATDATAFCMAPNWPERRACAEFIAAARTDLPALAASHEALRAEREALQTRCAAAAAAAAVAFTGYLDGEWAAVCGPCFEGICDPCIAARGTAGDGQPCRCTHAGYYAAGLRAVTAEREALAAALGALTLPMTTLLEQLRCIVEEEDWSTRAISLSTALEAWHWHPAAAPADFGRDTTRALLTTLRAVDAGLAQARMALDGLTPTDAQGAHSVNISSDTDCASPTALRPATGPHGASGGTAGAAAEA